MAPTMKVTSVQKARPGWTSVRLPTAKTSACMVQSSFDRLRLLDGEENADNEREQTGAFDETGGDEHRATEVTRRRRLTGDAVERRSGEAADAEADADDGEPGSDAGRQVRVRVVGVFAGGQEGECEVVQVVHGLLFVVGDSLLGGVVVLPIGCYLRAANTPPLGSRQWAWLPSASCPWWACAPISTLWPMYSAVSSVKMYACKMPTKISSK